MLSVSLYTMQSSSELGQAFSLQTTQKLKGFSNTYFFLKANTFCYYTKLIKELFSFLQNIITSERPCWLHKVTAVIWNCTHAHALTVAMMCAAFVWVTKCEINCFLWKHVSVHICTMCNSCRVQYNHIIARKIENTVTDHIIEKCLTEAGVSCSTLKVDRPQKPWAAYSFLTSFIYWCTLTITMMV